MYQERIGMLWSSLKKGVRHSSPQQQHRGMSMPESSTPL